MWQIALDTLLSINQVWGDTVYKLDQASSRVDQLISERQASPPLASATQLADTLER